MLFLYADGTKVNSTRDPENRGEDTSIKLTSNKTETVSVPLSLTVNSNKYFVTGYPEKVKVELTGPAALITTTANTQNFNVYADLSSLSVGKHSVRLQAEGLNSELRYKLKPAKIDIDIQPRKTVDYPLSIKYSKDNVAPGFEAGKPTTDVDQVQVTGASSQINRIDKVVAQLSIPQNATSTVSNQAIVEALDKNNKTVNVVITPSTVNVNLPITQGESKEVPIKLQPKGVDDNKEFTLTSDVKKVKVFGTQKQLNNIKEVIVDVDTSTIKEDVEEKRVALDAKLNDVAGFDPDSISVKIKNNS